MTHCGFCLPSAREIETMFRSDFDLLLPAAQNEQSDHENVMPNRGSGLNQSKEQSKDVDLGTLRHNSSFRNEVQSILKHAPSPRSCVCRQSADQLGKSGQLRSFFPNRRPYSCLPGLTLGPSCRRKGSWLHEYMGSA